LEGVNVNTLKRVGCLVGVFLAGGVTFANITALQHGIPAHYEADIGKIVLAIFLAIIFGAQAIRP
jgi:hypothetical protein